MSLSLALLGFYSAAVAVDKTLKLTGNGDSLLTRKEIFTPVSSSPIKGSDGWLYRAFYRRRWMSSPTCGGDDDFVHQNLLNKCLGCSRFVLAFGFDTREEAIQADRIVARVGMFQISARGHAPGFHSDLGEDGGVVALIPDLVPTAPLLYDGDDGMEEMKAARVSLKAFLGVGLVWVWDGSARASFD
ncbi:hypothetical protein ACLB2K_036562 [Fragaria x ananassa]